MITANDGSNQLADCFSISGDIWEKALSMAMQRFAKRYPNKSFDYPGGVEIEPFDARTLFNKCEVNFFDLKYALLRKFLCGTRTEEGANTTHCGNPVQFLSEKLKYDVTQAGVFTLYQLKKELIPPLHNVEPHVYASQAIAEAIDELYEEVTYRFSAPVVGNQGGTPVPALGEFDLYAIGLKDLCEDARELHDIAPLVGKRAREQSGFYDIRDRKTPPIKPLLSFFVVIPKKEWGGNIPDTVKDLESDNFLLIPPALPVLLAPDASGLNPFNATSTDRISDLNSLLVSRTTGSKHNVLEKYSKKEDAAVLIAEKAHALTTTAAPTEQQARQGRLCSVPARLMRLGGGVFGNMAAMRTDRPEEADYRWAVFGGPGNGHLEAVVRSIGLSKDNYIDNYSGKVTKNTERYPIEGSKENVAFFRTQLLDFGTLGKLAYFKQFTYETRKLEPMNPEYPPLLSPSFLTVVDAKASLRSLLSGSQLPLYRKKQKGEANVSPGGVAISSSKSSRSDAGKVMKKSLQIDSSATSYARGILSGQEADSYWKSYDRWTVIGSHRDSKKTIPNREEIRPRTNQEWCHLIGHAKGGADAAENLVAASYACNTEQLAIENALGCDPQLQAQMALKVTAYQFPLEAPRLNQVAMGRSNPSEFHQELFKGWKGQSVSSIIDAFTLGNIAGKRLSDEEIRLCIAALSKHALLNKEATTAFPQAPNSSWVWQEYFDSQTQALEHADYIKLSKRVRAVLSAELQETTKTQVALFIRYVVIKKQTGGRVFERMLDAQRESFDRNEFNLLHHCVQIRIAQAFSESPPDPLHDYPDFVRKYFESIYAKHKVSITEIDKKAWDEMLGRKQAIMGASIIDERKPLHFEPVGTGMGVTPWQNPWKSLLMELSKEDNGEQWFQKYKSSLLSGEEAATPDCGTSDLQNKKGGKKKAGRKKNLHTASVGDQSGRKQKTAHAKAGVIQGEPKNTHQKRANEYAIEEHEDVPYDPKKLKK